MADTQGVPNSDVIERAFGPDQVVAFRRQFQMSHVTNLRVDSLHKTPRNERRLEPLNAGRMAVDGHDGASRQVGEMQRLATDSTPQIDHPGSTGKSHAETESSGGAITIARSLPGQALKHLKEYLQETGILLVQGGSVFRSCRTFELRPRLGRAVAPATNS